jgi:hypothetical protein
MTDLDRRYGARPQARPAHWSAIRRDAPFRFDRVASIRAYTFRMGRAFDEIEQAKHCHDIVACDGTFCPSVSFPGVLLSDAQRDALLALVDDVVHRKHPASRCAFSPHHGFVFFDRDGTPIAELQVCFDCGEWSVSFASGSSLTGDGEVKLRKLCEQLHLGGCWFGTEPSPAQKSVEARGLLQDPPHAGLADLGVDPALVEAKATAVQKEILCRWANAEAYLWGRGPLRRRMDQGDGRDGAFGFQFDEGPSQALRVSVQDTASCVAKLPKCNVPVGAVERCYRARYPSGQLLRDDFVFPVKPPEVCEAASGCMWGVEETPVAVP